ncbi:hypothetical protein M0R19_05445 [Candidatus Pacearchaeota archaeon]|jgi:hypothetical protein|nr:hypothetical protein [Candidatus Pacearchaeota archaeon]
MLEILLCFFIFIVFYIAFARFLLNFKKAHKAEAYSYIITKYKKSLLDACEEIEKLSMMWELFYELKFYDNLDECSFTTTEKDPHFIVEGYSAFVGWSTNILDLLINNKMSIKGFKLADICIPSAVKYYLIQYKIDNFFDDLTSPFMQEKFWKAYHNEFRCLLTFKDYLK